LPDKKKPPLVLPTNDLAFKKLLSSPEHKEVARGFIGAFFGPEVAAGDITITNPYAIVGNPRDEGERRRLLKTFRDITFTVGLADLTVELQVRRERWFEQRALYYAFDLFNGHYHEVPPGEDEDRMSWYESLRPVYSLNVLGHEHFSCRHAVHMFPLKEVLWPGEGLELRWLRVGFVEFWKDVFASEGQRLWSEFLRSGVAPAGAPGYLEEAATIIKYMNLTGEEKAVIDLAEKDRALRVSEWANELEDAREEGEARGVAIGEARGEDRARRQMIEMALAGGRSFEDIAEVFRVPVGQIEAWAGLRGGYRQAG